ncbi:MAG: hypothetical protein ACAI35_26445 [Candidatus Methylacidiphilales bacterium]
MPDLRLTDTNAADDSSGSVWGLDGNLFLPVVASAALSIGLLLVFFAVLSFHWLLSALFAAVPFAGTLSYVLLLKQGKPAGYDRDLFELWISGPGFQFLTRGQQHFRRPNKSIDAPASPSSQP